VLLVLRRDQARPLGPPNSEVSESVRTANGELNGRAGLHGVDRREPIRLDANVAESRSGRTPTARQHRDKRVRSDRQRRAERTSGDCAGWIAESRSGRRSTARQRLSSEWWGRSGPRATIRSEAWHGFWRGGPGPIHSRRLLSGAGPRADVRRLGVAHSAAASPLSCVEDEWQGRRVTRRCCHGAMRAAVSVAASHWLDLVVASLGARAASRGCRYRCGRHGSSRRKRRPLQSTRA